MSFDWKAVVRTVAPGIASVFGTPLAGLGVTALLNVLLPADQKANPPSGVAAEDFLTQALQGISPESMLKIKDAEQQFQLDLKKLNIDLEKFLSNLAAQDTTDARKLKTHWLSTDKWDYEPMLAALVVGAFFYAEYWVFAHAISATTMDASSSVLVGRVLGTVDAAFMLLLSFRWGSSRSSERKTELAAQAQSDLTDKMK